MKLLNVIFFFSALAVIGLGEPIEIGYPPAHKKIHPGQHLTVQVLQPDSIEGPIVIGIAIGISSCGNKACPPPSQSVGTALFEGPYHPVLHQTKPYTFPYENFTVVVPTYLTKGTAQLNVVLAGLFGAGDFPAWETVNQTLIVV